MDADAPPQAHENEVDMMDAESTDTTQSPTHTNGVNGHTTEQPEKSDQTAQAESEKQTQKPKEPVIDKEAAEAFKEAGNKAFKSREWQDAIEEYTKGKLALFTTYDYADRDQPSLLILRLHLTCQIVRLHTCLPDATRQR